MALSQRLEFRQSQALVMTPQLMQAIKLLQLSNLDLSAYVEGELERNPLLERPSDGPEGPESSGSGQAAGSTDGAPEAQESDWKADVNGSAAIEDSFDTGIENVFPDAAEAPQRPAQADPAPYSEWSGVGAGGREDGD
jgi:RNA polymerase sigma-54 factor